MAPCLLLSVVYSNRHCRPGVVFDVPLTVGIVLTSDPIELDCLHPVGWRPTINRPASSTPLIVGIGDSRFLINQSISILDLKTIDRGSFKHLPLCEREK